MDRGGKGDRERCEYRMEGDSEVLIMKGIKRDKGDKGE